MVCDVDRDWLDRVLGEIVELYALLPEQLAPGQAAGPRVSGSREAPLPLRVDPLDLTMPARQTAVSDDLVPQYETIHVEVLVYGRPEPKRCDCPACEQTRAQARADGLPDPTGPGPVGKCGWRKVTMAQRVRRRDDRGILAYGLSGDQQGEPSVAGVLETWARDWQGYRWALLPEPTVEALAWWLSVRLDWACEHHPAVDEFAAEVFALAATLRRTCGMVDPLPELLDAPCARCDNTSLHRLPGEDRVECGVCGRLMTEDEYRRYVGLVVAHHRRDVA